MLDKNSNPFSFLMLIDYHLYRLVDYHLVEVVENHFYLLTG
ncbi:hypothetical protein HPSMNH_1672 [Glaesserella parasuis MN-H]|nr:hypothetical protein HPSMNH_1672 [Glaesserella parasuis MN-H]